MLASLWPGAAARPRVISTNGGLRRVTRDQILGEPFQSGVDLFNRGLAKYRLRQFAHCLGVPLLPPERLPDFRERPRIDDALDRREKLRIGQPLVVSLDHLRILQDCGISRVECRFNCPPLGDVKLAAFGLIAVPKEPGQPVLTGKHLVGVIRALGHGVDTLVDDAPR